MLKDMLVGMIGCTAGVWLSYNLIEAGTPLIMAWAGVVAIGPVLIVKFYSRFRSEIGDC